MSKIRCSWISADKSFGGVVEGEAIKEGDGKVQPAKTGHRICRKNLNDRNESGRLKSRKEGGRKTRQGNPLM